MDNPKPFYYQFLREMHNSMEQHIEDFRGLPLKNPEGTVNPNFSEAYRAVERIVKEYAHDDKTIITDLLSLMIKYFNRNVEETLYKKQNVKTMVKGLKILGRSAKELEALRDRTFLHFLKLINNEIKIQEICLVGLRKVGANKQFPTSRNKVFKEMFDFLKKHTADKSDKEIYISISELMNGFFGRKPLLRSRQDCRKQGPEHLTSTKVRPLAVSPDFFTPDGTRSALPIVDRPLKFIVQGTGELRNGINFIRRYKRNDCAGAQANSQHHRNSLRRDITMALCTRSNFKSFRTRRLREAGDWTGALCSVQKRQGSGRWNKLRPPSIVMDRRPRLHP
jgi:hypothetical protein